MNDQTSGQDFDYDLAVSFASEDRELVEVVVDRLMAQGVRVFLDRDHQVEMWGEYLNEYFDKIYRTKSRFAILFVSRHYATKMWTRHERRSALARGLSQADPYVLPVRLDDTDLEGLLPTVGYLDARQLNIDGIVNAALKKVRNRQQINDYVERHRDVPHEKTKSQAAGALSKGSKKPQDKARKANRRLVRIVGFCTVLAAILGATLAWSMGWFDVAEPEIDSTGLTQANFCSWRLGSHPMPLISQSPVKLRIDNRCNFPQDPNPKTDKPTGVYSTANQDSSNFVDRIPDGYLITVRCYIPDGEEVSDAVGNKSRIWLGIVSPAGLIPNVAVGGGYTEQQLTSFGLREC
ncbi:MAG: TIR domain-containing protein [Jatrophihabitantaceae bacterium]